MLNFPDGEQMKILGSRTQNIAIFIAIIHNESLGTKSLSEGWWQAATETTRKIPIF